MLVIHGFFENGVFIPNDPVVGLKGRQEATLTVQECTIKKQTDIWIEIIKDLKNCDEELTGEPERVHLKMPEEIDAL